MFKRDSAASKSEINNLNLVSRINLKAWLPNELLLNNKSIIILLVTVDLFFIAIYIGHFLVDNIFPNYTGFLLTSTKLSIQKDGTYPEMFQYLKEFIVAAIFDSPFPAALVITQPVS